MELPRRPVEDLLYAAMTSLLFYPRTLWRVLVEAGRESEVEKASEVLGGPPLFLAMSILVAQILDLALRVQVDGAAVVSPTRLLAFRLVAFSLLPLVLTVGALRREGRPIEHVALRGPFYLQCVYAAPLSISVSVAGVLLSSPHLAAKVAGVGLAGAALAWLLAVQTRWLGARLGVGRWRAFATAARLLAEAALLCFVAALLIFGPKGVAGA